jgi:hypothetical protein
MAALPNLDGARDIGKVINDASITYYALLRFADPNGFPDNGAHSEVLKPFQFEI